MGITNNYHGNSYGNTTQTDQSTSIDNSFNDIKKDNSDNPINLTDSQYNSGEKNTNMKGMNLFFIISLTVIFLLITSATLNWQIVIDFFKTHFKI